MVGGPLRKGAGHLAVLRNWHGRRVLSWRLSSTLEAELFADGLEVAIARFEPPEIMNTDQGRQFTTLAWIDLLMRAGARISMGGRGRFRGTIFIERLSRSFTSECVYLRACETGSQALAGLRDWFDLHDRHRPHRALGGQTRDVIGRRRATIIQSDQKTRGVAQIPPDPVRRSGGSSNVNPENSIRSPPDLGAAPRLPVRPAIAGRFAQRPGYGDRRERHRRRPLRIVIPSQVENVGPIAFGTTGGANDERARHSAIAERGGAHPSRPAARTGEDGRSGRPGPRRGPAGRHAPRQEAVAQGVWLPPSESR